MRSEHIATRVSKGTYETIESIRQENQTDQSATIEELLERGISDWKLETAIEQYQTGVISVEIAAERAGLSHWEFLDVLEAREESEAQSEPVR
jgi:predicted HTH domain antitoxin